MESKGLLWTGRVVSGLITLFLLFDGITHLLMVGPVVDAFNRLGLPLGLGPAIGITELVCLALYLVPRTSQLGVLLLTGYLGGAIAIQLRAGSPIFAETLFPLYTGIFLWAGLFLRNKQVRAFILLRNQN